MKKFFLAFCLLCLHGIASNAQGIRFLSKLSFEKALALAKAQKKILFVEIYAPDCHVCTAFKPTLGRPAVGNFYNSKFISIQLDARQASTYALVNDVWKLRLNTTPSFLFFDPQSRQLVQAKMFSEHENSEQQVLAIAQKAADPKEHLPNMAKRFQSGERQAGFLLNYAELSRIKADTLTSIQVLSAYLKVWPKSAFRSPAGFRLIQKIMLDNQNPLFEDFVANLKQYERFSDANQCQNAYEQVFQAVLTGSRSQGLGAKALAQIKQQMKQAGLDANGILRRTWMAETHFLFKTRQDEEALKRLQQLLNALPNAAGPREYQYLCDYVKKKSKHPKTLAFAKKNWCSLGLTN